MNELARAEAVDVHLWEFAFDVRQQIQVPLLRQFGMMPALHQDLRAADCERLLNLLINLIERDHVSVVIFFDTIKSAEFTIDVTNVCVIDVPVDDVSDNFVATTIIRLSLCELTAPV